MNDLDLVLIAAERGAQTRAEADAIRRVVAGRRTAIAAIAHLLDEHIPSLTEENEKELDEMVESFITGEEAQNVGDLAIRTCKCGKRIDGFYEYVDHLKEVLRGPSGT